MSNSGTRPRPRPRPVARTPAVAPAPTPTPGVHSSNATTSSGKSQYELEDEDAFFMRNRGRTAQHWKNLEKRVKENAGPIVDGKSDEDDDRGESNTSTPKRRYKKKSKRETSIPLWQQTDVTTLLTSDDDDELEVIEEGEGSGQSPLKRKRERSRSRSITPPPALTMHQIQTAKNLVRQTLNSPTRPASPTYLGDDSTDTIVLDPELAKIAQSIRSQVHLKTNEPEPVGGPEIVTITVKWQPHPENVEDQMHVWGFKLKRHDTLQVLFEELADMVNTLASSLVISHNGKRVFSSATPHSLRIWATGELEACDKKTHEYIRTNRYKRPPSPSLDEFGGPKPHSPAPDDELGADTDSESTGGDKLRLVLRSATTKQINLTVRTTATCGAIVEAFLKAAGLSVTQQNARKKGVKSKKGVSAPRLMIDGEKMDPSTEIGDADLEDGDLVEVVDL